MDYLNKYEEWLNNPYIDDVDKEELLQLKNDEEEIMERFSENLEFGTAGIRGIRGMGANRMNKYNIRLVTQGYANYLKNMYPDAGKRGVAIAYDPRIMSKEFAIEAAKVFSGNGIKVYLFEDYCSTPELAYAIRELKTVGGLVLTASHNPVEYNGYKAYNAHGCQLSTREAEMVIEEISGFSGLEDVVIDEKGKKIKTVGAALDKKYLKKVRRLHKGKSNPDLKVAFTPLHGVGGRFVKKLMDDLKYNYVLVEEQFLPDGSFPTTKKPNPEESAALKLLTSKGEEWGADILLATDPDADRLGVVVKNGEKYQMLSGNQVGALLIDHLIHNRKSKETKKYIIKTIVTDEFGAAVAKKSGVGVTSTLTGFKYIGAKYDEILEKGYKVIFAYEESIGFLAEDFIRDKDGISAALLVMEMAGSLKKNGKNLIDRLEELYKECGYFREKTLNFYYEGKEGKKHINAIMKDFRENKEEIMKDLNVRHFQDFLNQVEGFEKANVLRFSIDSGSWFALRPSGTEPKIKIYVGTHHEDREIAEEKLANIEKYINERLAKVTEIGA